MTYQQSQEVQLQMARYQTVDLFLIAQIMTAVACIVVAVIAWLSGAIA